MAPPKDPYKEALTHQEELAFAEPGSDDYDRLIEKRNGALRKVLESSRAISASGDKEAIYLIGSALLFLSEGSEEGPQAGLSLLPEASVCQELTQSQKKILDFHHKSVLSLQGRVLERCCSDARLSHKQKRQALEGALKVLLEMNKGGTSSPGEVLLTLSRAYLYRSLLVRPKGFTVPANKIEALEKALQFLEEARRVPAGSQEYWRLKALAYLELERLKKAPPDIKQVLEEAVRNAGLKFGERPENENIVLTFAKLSGVDDTTKSFLDPLLSSEATALSKARAAVALGSSETECYVRKAIDSVRSRWFSDPSWEMLVDLIRNMAKSNHPSWKELALEAWRTCSEEEKRVRHGCHLRWYWSRQRDLYDLAFHAAATPREKAEVADSLKNRPALSWKDAEKVDPDYARQMAEGLAGHYIKDFALQGDLGDRPADPPEFHSLPEPWIAIHLYVSSNALERSAKRKGYALIYDAETKSWSEREFEIGPLWNAFWSFQESYFLDNTRDYEKTWHYLKALCKTIGSEMGFLFGIERNRPVLFVPHDFLHRLPLHMGIRAEGSDERVWAEEHPSAFLPAWWQWDPANVPINGRKALLKCFEDGYYEELLSWTSWDYKALDAKSDDLFAMSSQPESPLGLLFLLCHGRAHATNPYSSGLVLRDGLLSHLDFISRQPRIDGCRVFLGACETELVPPLGTPVDEHLSISSAFLSRGAVEVLGTLYQVTTKENELLGETILRDASKPLWKLLWEWHQGKVKDYWSLCCRAKDLFYSAAFRVLGFCPTSGPPEARER